MDESSVYNESDVAPFCRRLNDLRTIIKSDSESGKHSHAMTKLLERQLWDCGASLAVYYSSHLNSHVESVLNRMQDNLSVLSEELQPVHERLVTIRRKLVGLAAKGGCPKAELKPLQEELRKIDSLRIFRLRRRASDTHAPFSPLSPPPVSLCDYHTPKHVGNV